MTARAYPIRCNEVVDHAECPHQYGSSIRIWKNPARGTFALLCDCECHGACPLWPATEVPFDDWMELCSCPGAPWAKGIHRSTKEESETRKALTKEAIEEVINSQPKGREEIIRALEQAYERRGIDLLNIERESLPDVVEARLAPRPLNQLLAMKAIGGIGFHLVREIRRILSDDGGSTSDQD